MLAIISDIHSNLEALTEVLEDIASKGIKSIYCLGDVIGYGPNPQECLDMVIEKTEWCVMGNHDYATVYEPTNFNYGAERASFWTRSVLEKAAGTKNGDRRWKFLGELPMRRRMKMKLGQQTTIVDFLHASPRRPINEYVFPDDVYTNPVKVKMSFDQVAHICFIGHTHLPGVFLDEPDFYLPQELGDSYPITSDEKAIINIGSVGQPRDGDNRASYAYIEGRRVHFVRLKYDYKSTAEKIRKINELDDFQAERLADGR